MIIDLPEMLEVAKKNILKHSPKVIKYLTFLTPEQKPTIQFDGFFNFMSFCEMEEKEIAEYFNLIYATAKPQAIFFNENSHKKIKNKDGSVSDNNPLLFPYRGKTILWETDEIRKVNKPFNPAYIRIEVI